jgi:hypothetical protein
LKNRSGPSCPARWMICVPPAEICTQLAKK